MASNLIAPRTITKGPGRHDWLMAIIHPRQIIDMKIRGLYSKCDCPMGDTCTQCERVWHAYLRVMGSFSADAGGNQWVFFALLSISHASLRGVDGVKLHGDLEEVQKNLGPDVRFVYGRYDLNCSGLQWLQQAPMSLYNTFLAMNNASFVRPEVWGDRVTNRT